MDVAERAGEHQWYHSLELGPDYLTPGVFDLRSEVESYHLPARLDGVRALDVGTWDGFWAFEMERRGATVVALDLDDESRLDTPVRRKGDNSFSTRPRGDGFRLAREILGSKVERVDMSLYDANSAELGTFDLVFCGSVVIHLRDQLLALERIAELCTGTFITAEAYTRGLGLLPFAATRYVADRPSAVVYWQPNVRAWKQMLWTAGFNTVEEVERFAMHSTQGYKVRHVVHHASDSAHHGP